jgi:quercetin dioxygenase-like cupin family protein
LPEVYASARLAGAEVARLTDAFERIAPLLTWKVRPSSGPHASDNWPDGHANAMIIGQGGIEERGDIAIGASLMARHVRYPDHTHPPEELYMILTQGRFQHGDEPWCEPGPGATFHNTPGIRHAMASGAGPLLAVWTMLVA